MPMTQAHRNALNYQSFEYLPAQKNAYYKVDSFCVTPVFMIKILCTFKQVERKLSNSWVLEQLRKLFLKFLLKAPAFKKMLSE